MKRVSTGALGAAEVWLREGTADEQVWADTFTGLYHLPPRWMPEPRTVLDLGANIGLTAAHYQKLWPDAKVVAVEMDMGNARVAKLNFPGRTVVVAVAAVAGGRGIASYDPTVAEDAYRLGPVSSLASPTPTISLTELIKEEFDGGTVDFVKMDIEGTEWEILGDAIFGRPSVSWDALVRSLLVELHPNGSHRGEDSDDLIVEATEMLRALGYEVYRSFAHPRALYAAR